MPLVNFAIQGNGEESEGGSQMSENPGLQIMAPHNRVRTSPASKEDKYLNGVMRWRRQSRDTRAVLQEPGCPGSAWFKPALTHSTGLLALDSVALSAACMNRGVVPSSPGSKESCVGAL